MFRWLIAYVDRNVFIAHPQLIRTYMRTLAKCAESETFLMASEGSESTHKDSFKKDYWKSFDTKIGYLKSDDTIASELTWVADELTQSSDSTVWSSSINGLTDKGLLSFDFGRNEYQCRKCHTRFSDELSSIGHYDPDHSWLHPNNIRCNGFWDLATVSSGWIPEDVLILRNLKPPSISSDFHTALERPRRVSLGLCLSRQNVFGFGFPKLARVWYQALVWQLEGWLWKCSSALGIPDNREGIEPEDLLLAKLLSQLPPPPPNVTLAEQSVGFRDEDGTIIGSPRLLPSRSRMGSSNLYKNGRVHRYWIPHIGFLKFSIDGRLGVWDWALKALSANISLGPPSWGELTKSPELKMLSEIKRVTR